MSPRKLSDDTYAELFAEADAFTRECVFREGRFFRNELSAHLAQRLGADGQAAIGPSVLQRLLHELRAEHLGDKEGYSRHGLQRMRPATLADLAALARDSVDVAYTPPRGRRASRDVPALTAAQLANVLTAAAEVAEMITGDRANLAGVGPEHFNWLPTAGELGQGEWALVERIEAYSDATAERDYRRASKSGAAVWHRDMNASRRKAHAAGARILLDLAATKDRLPRGDAPSAYAHATRRAAEWHPHCVAWTARLVGDIRKSKRKIEQGVKTLALYATRQGALSPAETDWSAVRDAIERDARRETNPISNDVRTWAAYSYRALRERGLIEAPDWPKAATERMSLVQTGIAGRSVPKGDFSTWVDDEGRHPAALCSTLTAWHAWATLPDDLLEEEHRAGRLPLRMWPNATAEQQVRAARDESLFRLDTATVAGRIATFNLAAGFAARHRRADFIGDPDCDLALVDPDALQAHIRHRHPGRADAKDSLMASLGWHLATLASPFLEAHALLQRERALAEGDHLRAERLLGKAAQLRQHSARLQVVAARATPAKRKRDSDGEELTRKQIQRIWQLWTADGVSGWHKLGLMRDAMLRDIERVGVQLDPEAKAAGLLALPIAEQIAAIRAGRFRPTMGWAVLVRDAVIVTLLFKVPLRLRNVVGMTFENLKRLESGAMQLEYTAAETKADRSFEPPVLTAEELTDPHALAMVRPDLWELYLMAGGARDEILRLTSDPGVSVREWTALVDAKIEGRRRRVAEARWRFIAPAGEPSATREERDRVLRAGDVCPSRYVFPAVARKGGGHGLTLAERVRAELAYDGDAFAQQFKKRMREYAGVMNINADALDAYFGSLSPHIVRLLFGSHHCDEKRWPDAIGIDAASTLLHHVNTDITRRKYVARNERATSAVSRRTGEAGTAGAPAAAPPDKGGYADELRRAADRLEAGVYTLNEFLALKAALNARFGVATAA